MRFTKFLLANYLATEKGAQALAFFQNLPKYVVAGDPDGKIKNFIDGLLLSPLAAEWYALRLNCQGLLLASCEGIWLSFARDNYDVKKLEFFDWDGLREPDVFHAIKLKIGGLLKKKWSR